MGNPRLSMALGNIIGIIGAFIYAFAGPESWFLVVGYSLFGIGGLFIHLATFNISYLFPKIREYILSTIVCTFSLSSLLVQLISIVYFAGFSRKAVFLGYGLILGLNILLGCVAQQSKPFEDGDIVVYTKSGLQRIPKAQKDSATDRAVDSDESDHLTAKKPTSEDDKDAKPERTLWDMATSRGFIAVVTWYS